MVAAIINYVDKGNSREALRPSAASVHRGSDFAQSPICPAGKLSVCLWARAYGLWMCARCRHNMRPTPYLSCAERRPASQFFDPAPTSPQTLTWSERCSGRVCTARSHSETSWPLLLFRTQPASSRAHHMRQARARRRLFQARRAGRVAGRYAHPMSRLQETTPLMCPAQRSSGRGGVGNIKYTSKECLSIAEDPEPDDAVSIATGREAPAAKPSSVSRSLACARDGRRYSPVSHRRHTPQAGAAQEI